MILLLAAVAASAQIQAFFQPPKGWVSIPVPPGAVAAGWAPPGHTESGENILVYVETVPKGTTFDSLVKRRTAEAFGQGHTIADSKAQTTCHGAQPGWTLDVRLPVTPQRTIEQVQHFALRGNSVYTVIYTHTAGTPISKVVLESIDSLCPAKV